MDLSTLSTALEALDVPTLTSLCERSELDAAAKDASHPHATLHLLTLLLRDDLTEARFLWRRLPTTTREKPDTSAAWALARALWKSDMPAFFGAAKYQGWGDADRLVAALVDITRRKNAELVARAYSSVSLTRVAALLGMETDGVLQLCAREGWTVEGDFVVVAKRRGASEGGRPGVESRELHRLTEQLVRLQTTG